jgi:hypothetical protein
MLETDAGSLSARSAIGQTTFMPAAIRRLSVAPCIRSVPHRPCYIIRGKRLLNVGAIRLEHLVMNDGVVGVPGHE